MADQSGIVESLGTPYHIGLLVPNLEQAMATLGIALGITWTETYSVQVKDYGVRIVFSTQEPYLELCEGTDGSPWKCSSAGIELHHLGYWTDDYDKDAARLEKAGLAIEWNGSAEGLGRKVGYYRLPNEGGLIELVESTRKEWLDNLVRSAQAR